MHCRICHKGKVTNKKHELCSKCYQKFYRRSNGHLTSADSVTSPQAIKKHENEGEIEFIRNFFDHTEWIYEPASFKINGCKYTPDFYDIRRGVFIEVAATRQAFSFNKDKYELFRKTYSHIAFEVRKPSGELISLSHLSDVPVSNDGASLTRTSQQGNGDNAPDTVLSDAQVEPIREAAQTASEQPSLLAEMR